MSENRVIVTLKHTLSPHYVHVNTPGGSSALAGVRLAQLQVGAHKSERRVVLVHVADGHSVKYA
jgi:hypothetical protein